MIAAGGAVMACIFPFCLPRLKPETGTSPLAELSALRHSQVLLTVATASIGSGGMFAVYTSITPTLTEVTAIPESLVPLYLGFWGAGMVVGNVLGVKWADRYQTRAIIGLLLWNAIALFLFWPSAGNRAAAAIAMMAIGAGFALVPTLQARLMDSAPGGESLAGAFNHLAFNVANALGAWTGGLR